MNMQIQTRRFDPDRPSDLRAAIAHDRESLENRFQEVFQASLPADQRADLKAYLQAPEDSQSAKKVAPFRGPGAVRLIGSDTLEVRWTSQLKGYDSVRYCLKRQEREGGEPWFNATVELTHQDTTVERLALAVLGSRVKQAVGEHLSDVMAGLGGFEYNPGTACENTPQGESATLFKIASEELGIGGWNLVHDPRMARVTEGARQRLLKPIRRGSMRMPTDSFD